MVYIIQVFSKNLMTKDFGVSVNNRFHPQKLIHGMNNFDLIASS